MLVDYWHFSYADDHLTIILVEVDDETYPSALCLIDLNILIQGIRGALEKSCAKVGAKLNTDKSEVICADDISNKIFLAKNECVWLGFSFKCTVKERV